jgi:hypothetical protein
MIGIENQYILKIDIGDFEDFIEKEDLVSLLIIEEAGGVLPSFELSFYTEEEDIIGYINEGNNVKISLGKNKNSLLDYSMVVLSFESTSVGQTKYQITLSGLYNSLKYLTDGNVYISDKISGVEEMSRIGGQYFNVVSNITSSSDSQNWIQPNISDRAFISEIWLRSYIPGSFLLFAISSEGDFILKDVKTLVGTDAIWEFLPSEKSKSNQIIFDPRYTAKTSTGVFNQWLGYNREKNVFNVDDGESSIIAPSFNSFLSQTPSLNRSADVNKKIDDFGLVLENVHDKYQEAYIQNTTYLGLFSTVGIPISFTGIFEDVKVLDLVFFKDKVIQDVKMASEYYSGLYIVSLVSRQVVNGQFKTNVILNRESGNKMTGNLS